MFKKGVANRILVVGLHVCGWALLFLLPFGFSARHAGRPPAEGGLPAPDRVEFMERATLQFDPSLMRYEALITNTLLALFFYANMFLLIPKVLNRKGWLHYMGVVVLSFIVYASAGYAFRLFFLPFPFRFAPPFFIGMPYFLMVFGLSLALRIVQDRVDFESLKKEQETERLKSELSFLRSQVSPHFMFNVLNSLAALARKKSDQVESAIIQLSELMRHTLYHSDKKVSIEQEAEYIRNYINLQKLRFGSLVNMHFHVELLRKDLEIEPMLLVPFVENSFKHGVGLIEDPIIIITLTATEYQINFSVRNKFNPSDNETKDSSSGIGLQNVKRRLDLLYKDLYSLNSHIAEDHWYVTELKLIVK
jgi:two-component system, LytTR family, sensor kinase